LFATGVVYIGGKFAAGIVDTGRELPPVFTTQAKIVKKFAASVVDTSGALFLSNISGNFRKNLKGS
jgi:hypothetical protein